MTSGTRATEMHRRRPGGGKQLLGFAHDRPGSRTRPTSRRWAGGAARARVNNALSCTPPVRPLWRSTKLPPSGVATATIGRGPGGKSSARTLNRKCRCGPTSGPVAETGSSSRPPGRRSWTRRPPGRDRDGVRHRHGRRRGGGRRRCRGGGDGGTRAGGGTGRGFGGERGVEIGVEHLHAHGKLPPDDGVRHGRDDPCGRPDSASMEANTAPAGSVLISRSSGASPCRVRRVRPACSATHPQKPRRLTRQHRGRAQNFQSPRGPRRWRRVSRRWPEPARLGRGSPLSVPSQSVPRRCEKTHRGAH